jgi:hypothetical protein
MALHAPRQSVARLEVRRSHENSRCRGLTLEDLEGAMDLRRSGIGRIEGRCAPILVVVAAAIRTARDVLRAYTCEASSSSR